MQRGDDVVALQDTSNQIFPHADSPTASFPSYHHVLINPENNGIEKREISTSVGLHLSPSCLWVIVYLGASFALDSLPPASAVKAAKVWC